MYIVLRPPWQRHLVPSADRPPVVIVPLDAGPGKPVSKKRRSRTAGAASAGDPAPEEVAPLPLTTADRALEWRGDDIARPPQKLDLAGPDDARPLDDAEISEALHGQADAVKDCVIQGASNTDLRATITIKLLVDGRGRVTRSRVHAPHYLHEHGLLGCARRAVARIQFPATGAPTQVSFPVNLD